MKLHFYELSGFYFTVLARSIILFNSHIYTVHSVLKKNPSALFVTRMRNFQPIRLWECVTLFLKHLE